jgi:hypothetical protein
VLEIYPDHSASRNNLAVLYMRTDQFDKAVAHLAELRERGFEFPGAAGNLSESYIGLGKNDEAVEVMREFVQKFPDNENGYSNLGLAELSVNRLDDADKSFRRSLRGTSEFSADRRGNHAAGDPARTISPRRAAWRRRQLKAPQVNARVARLREPRQHGTVSGTHRGRDQASADGVEDQGAGDQGESALHRTVIAEILRARGARRPRQLPKPTGDRRRARSASCDGRIAAGRHGGLAEIAAETSSRGRHIAAGSDKAAPLPDRCRRRRESRGAYRALELAARLRATGCAGCGGRRRLHRIRQPAHAAGILARPRRARRRQRRAPPPPTSSASCIATATCSRRSSTCAACIPGQIAEERVIG